MPKWRVLIAPWDWEGEANDEGDALIQADIAFSFMNQAIAEEIEQEEESDESV